MLRIGEKQISPQTSSIAINNLYPSRRVSPIACNRLRNSGLRLGKLTFTGRNENVVEFDNLFLPTRGTLGQRDLYLF